MSQHGFIMPRYEEHPIQKPESNMSRHALIMLQHAKVDLIAEFEVMPQHDKIMPRHDDPDLKILFLKIRF